MGSLGVGENFASEMSIRRTLLSRVFQILENFKWLKFLSDQSNSYSLGQNLSRDTIFFQKFWYLDQGYIY